MKELEHRRRASAGREPRRMKKVFLTTLLLSLPVLADPAPFGAKFARPYTRETVKEGQIFTYQYGTPTQSQIVAVMKEPMTFKALKAYILKNIPPRLGHYEEKAIRISNHPAIQLEGINKDGVPYSIVLVNAKGRSVMAGSATYDMAANREFIHSLKF